jgi:hypothetical protein
MKYFLDCEFHEGFYKPFMKPNRHFIDLISIGIVCEDGREYYAISKDFDIKAAWNKYDKKINTTYNNTLKEEIAYNSMYIKDYWLRDNVLKPIFQELLLIDEPIAFHSEYNYEFTYGSFKSLINKYGKSNLEIRNEIINFTSQYSKKPTEIWDRPEFYGYYADYDWVLFCSLFGRMINLPSNYPMYCKDLKQIYDDLVFTEINNHIQLAHMNLTDISNSVFNSASNEIRNNSDYPQKENEHNALADAKWNKKLYDFLKSYE